MISSAIRKVGPFIGNGSASVFPFTFKVFSKADLVVVQEHAGVETTLTVDSDFTAALNADQDGSPGGSITLTAGALAVGYTLIISSNIQETQQTQLTNLGGFFPEVITAALDKLTILAQQLQEQLDRAVTLPITDPSLDTELPPASSRLGKLLGFDSNTGAPVALTLIGDLVTGDMTYARLDGGNTPFTGPVQVKTLNAVRYADQFSGATWTAKIQAAHDDLPSTGGIIDARGISGAQSSAASSITLTKPCTLLLGAGTYPLAANQILTSANGISIIGSGKSVTNITYTGSAGAIYGSLGAQTEIDHLCLRDFTLDGSGSGAGSLGIHQITPVRHHYSRLYITGFTNNIKLDGSQNYGTLNVLDSVTSRSAVSSALWLFGNADLSPIYSGRVIANTSILNGDYHTATGGTSIKLDSAGIVYISSNLIENAVGNGIGIDVRASSTTSFSQDIKVIGNDLEGLTTGINIQANCLRTSIAFNDYFSVTTQLADAGTITTKLDLDSTATDLYALGKGTDVNTGGTSSGPRVITDAASSNPRIRLYRPSGGSTWFPFYIRNNNGNFELVRGDATATIGSEGNVNAVFIATSLGAFTFADSTGATHSTISSAGAAAFNGGVQAGSSGTPLTQIKVYSQTITPSSVGAATVAEQTFTVTGLTTADKVVVNPAATGNATAAVSFRVSAANTLAVQFVNPTAGSLTPGAGTWNIIAIRS